MDQIGYGLQYNVFQLSDTQVLKKPRSYNEKVSLCKEWAKDNRNFRGLRGIAAISRADRDLKKSLQFIQKNFHRIDSTLIGNLSFIDNFQYLQTKGIPLLSFIQSHNLAENQKVLDEYIFLIKNLWEYGFVETTYNFTVNFGVNSESRVYLMDIGEITSSKARIARMIKSKMWLKSSSYRSDLKNLPKLKEHFEVQTEKYWTLNAFEKHWRLRMNLKAKNDQKNPSISLYHQGIL